MNGFEKKLKNNGKEVGKTSKSKVSGGYNTGRNALQERLRKKH